MDRDSVLSRLEALLAEERACIVALDAPGVERASDEKQALLDALRDGPALDAALRARVEALRPALQHNLILLAHARDALRDALAALRLGGLATSGAAASRPASRIHVTG